MRDHVEIADPVQAVPLSVDMPLSDVVYPLPAGRPLIVPLTVDE